MKTEPTQSDYKSADKIHKSHLITSDEQLPPPYSIFLLIIYFLTCAILPKALKYVIYDLIEAQIKSMTTTAILTCSINILLVGIICYATTFMTNNDIHQLLFSLCAIAFVIPTMCKSSWLDIYRIISLKYASTLCFLVPMACFSVLCYYVEPHAIPKLSSWLATNIQRPLRNQVYDLCQDSSPANPSC